MSRLFRVLGVLFVLGLVGGALAGLMLVGERIRIVVQTDEVRGAADPVALLRDEVATLQRDLAELSAGLSENFERLGTSLDQRSEARHEALRGAMERLKGESERQATELKRLAAGFERVGRDLAAAVARAPALEERRAPEPVPEAKPETVAEAKPEPVAQAKPKERFLSFSVPRRTFPFDVEQVFELLPNLCRVGFDAKSTLHDFTGVTSAVTGSFTARLDDPDGAWSGAVACDATSLTTGLADRDDSMGDYLDTKHHGRIAFEIESFEPKEIDAEARKCSGTIVGRMTIRGMTNEVRMPIELHVDASRRVVVEGQMPLRISDYGVPIPSQLGGAIRMEDEVEVWIALRARPGTGGGK